MHLQTRGEPANFADQNFEMFLDMHASRVCLLPFIHSLEEQRADPVLRRAETHCHHLHSRPGPVPRDPLPKEAMPYRCPRRVPYEAVLYTLVPDGCPLRGETVFYPVAHQKPSVTISGNQRSSYRTYNTRWRYGVYPDPHGLGKLPLRDPDSV